MYVSIYRSQRRQQQDAAFTPSPAAAAPPPRHLIPLPCALSLSFYLFDADQAEIFKIENMLEMQHIAEVVGRGLYELETGSTLDECPTEWRAS